MRELRCFSANTVAQFDNSYENMQKFNELLINAANRVYVDYSADETNQMIRTQADKIFGIDFKNATAMKRRQAYREHSKEWASLVEDVIVDRMNSGWNTSNARFMQFVRDVNIADGDKNEFYVEDNSLLQVAKFAGNHHDIIRQHVKPGKSFSIETSWYVIKTYADYEAFQLGKIDFATMVDKMYATIEQYRYAALYTAFMSADKSLPTDMKLSTDILDSTKNTIIERIEAVKAVTGKDVILVGTRTAIQKLQSTVTYNMYSSAMKDEQNKNGILANWEGYECLALDRVNKAGTRESVFSADDNKKIFIIPVGIEPFIIRVNEGDVIYTEAGMDGTTMDMTATADIRYQEGVGVVISELFGEIIANN